MANEPSVSWYEYAQDGVTIQPLTMWQLGTVEADGNSDLTIKRFVVWNNKGGASALQTMRNVKVGTRTMTGDFNLPIIKEKWTKGKFPVSSGRWFDIGANDVAGVWTANEMPVQAIGTVSSGTIEGNINDGTMAGANNNKNYTIFDLKMVIPPSASAGLVQAKLRMAYEITG